MATAAIPARRDLKPREVVGKVLLYVSVAGITVMTVFPIYWMIVSSIQPNKYTMHYPPPFWPQEIDLKAFVSLFAEHPLALWIRNSFLIALMAMLVCMALTVLGAYALSSLRWTGRNAFGLFLLVTQMLPEILIIIPLYIIYRAAGLLDSMPALSVVDAAFALPICIWILKNVFDSVPRECIDAAVVDGCTDFSVLWRIVLPLSVPGLVAIAVVSFFSAWNEYLFAVILLSSGQFQPASVGMTTLRNIADTPIEQYMAAGTIFSILPVTFYLVMQRYIISGLTAGAVKG